MVTRFKKDKIEIGRDRPVQRTEHRQHLRTDLSLYARTRYNADVGNIEDFVNEFLSKYPNHLNVFERSFIHDMAARLDRYGWR